MNSFNAKITTSNILSPLTPKNIFQTYNNNTQNPSFNTLPTTNVNPTPTTRNGNNFTIDNSKSTKLTSADKLALQAIHSYDKIGEYRKQHLLMITPSKYFLDLIARDAYPTKKSCLELSEKLHTKREFTDRTGHPSIKLGAQHRVISRIMYLIAHPDIADNRKLRVKHTCGNTHCVNIEHLGYMQSGNKKLETVDYDSIVELYNSGESITEIARAFDVHPSTVSLITTGKRGYDKFTTVKIEKRVKTPKKIINSTRKIISATAKSEREAQHPFQNKNTNTHQPAVQPTTPKLEFPKVESPKAQYPKAEVAKVAAAVEQTRVEEEKAGAVVINDINQAVMGQDGIINRPNIDVLLAKFEKHSDITQAGCQIWLGTMRKYGAESSDDITSAGIVYVNKQKMYVHEIAWQSVNGDIAAGDMVIRACGNERCFNVNHLMLKTAAVEAAIPRNEFGLTEEDVEAIKNSPELYSVLAKRYKINQYVIKAIKVQLSMAAKAR